jgi:hypothetical protein
LAEMDSGRKAKDSAISDIRSDYFMRDFSTSLGMTKRGDDHTLQFEMILNQRLFGQRAHREVGDRADVVG